MERGRAHTLDRLLDWVKDERRSEGAKEFCNEKAICSIGTDCVAAGLSRLLRHLLARQALPEPNDVPHSPSIILPIH